MNFNRNSETGQGCLEIGLVITVFLIVCALVARAAINTPEWRELISALDMLK